MQSISSAVVFVLSSAVFSSSAASARFPVARQKAAARSNDTMRFTIRFIFVILLIRIVVLPVGIGLLCCPGCGATPSALLWMYFFVCPVASAFRVGFTVASSLYHGTVPLAMRKRNVPEKFTVRAGSSVCDGEAASHPGNGKAGESIKLPPAVLLSNVPLLQRASCGRTFARRFPDHAGGRRHPPPVQNR